MFTLTTDTSIDIYKKELERNNVKYLPLTYRINGNEYRDVFSNDLDFDSFYNLLRSSETIPTTSQISPFEHEQFFKEVYAENHLDILHLSLSSGLSTTYDSAKSGAESFMASQKKANVYVADTLGATAAALPIYLKAVELRDSGISAKNAVKILTEYAQTIRVFIICNDLNYLVKGGRISKFAAQIGMSLNIKPVIVFDHLGKLKVYKKALGLQKALKIVLNDMKNNIKEDAAKYWIAHSGAKELALKTAASFKSDLNIDADISWIGPVIGSHTGPGTIGFVFESKNGRIFNL